jgi:hypothetical protein
MKFKIPKPIFRPITIVLETQDDFDKLTWIIGNVAENKLNHAPQVIAEAKRILHALKQVKDD